MATLCITSLPIIAQDGVRFQASSLEAIGRIPQNKLSQHANMLAVFSRKHLSHRNILVLMFHSFGGTHPEADTTQCALK